MLRRLLVLLAALAAGLALAASAAALTVHVRVEGLTRTIFGAEEPLLEPFVGTLRAEDGSLHPLAKPTALGALEAASRRGEFHYRLRSLSFGLFVDRIGRYPSGGAAGWVYKVNGVSPPVGAGDYVLADGDTVVWYFARFGAKGGPRTLLLRPGEAGCLVAVAQDDAGKEHAVREVTFRVDGRRVEAPRGVLCPEGRWRALRATKRGFVQSAVVRPR